MKSISGLPATAAHRTLTRLRWVLTITFTLGSAAGLVLFAWLTVRTDAERGEQALDGQLQRVTLAAIQNITPSNGSVSLQKLQRSGLTRQCPGFVVLPGSARPFLGISGDPSCPLARLSDMNRVATQATRTNSIVSSVVPGDGNGHRMRVLAEPFRVSGQVSGAVVAVVDSESELARHRRVVLIATLGSILIVVGLGVGAHLLSGRAMRPAANALQQQELFLSESAHDLRTPVAALRALAETALDNPSQRGVLLPRTVALAQRMGNIIEDLLVRARLAAGVAELNLQPVRLDQLVAGVVDDLPSATRAMVTVWTSPCAVMADTPLVQRAVGNLIDNALKYGKYPGEPAQVDVSVEEGYVTVADHGPGLSADAPVARTRARTSGSAGLGLSIVRWVADTHGGHVTSGNGPQGGAVFVLALPLR